MQVCQRCKTQEATIHFSRQVDGSETVNAHLCEGCAGPLLERQKALSEGPYPCEFCERDAFSQLPALRKLTYACCGCRRQYLQILFEVCAEERPELVQRSNRDGSFFDTCFEPEIEEWADLAGGKAVERLRGA
jgi:hypothetical protein